jgi:beta-lactamase class D
LKIKLLLLCCVLALNVAAQNDENPFQTCHVKGSTTIYDFNSRKWTTTDDADSRRGSQPASTFKIINLLIALETGVIKNEDAIIKWPGKTDTTRYGYRPDIYRDMSVREAFEKGDDFWNFGNFYVSPRNQIEFLIRVYENKTVFSKKNIAILKKVMITEKTINHTLRSKTGWTRVEGLDIGWWVGYLETKENVYFFATRITKQLSIANPGFGECRKTITWEFLKQMDAL